MNRRLIILIISFFIFTSCRNSEKSNEVMREAIDVYIYPKLNDDIRIEKSLELTNKALDLDSQNLSALGHKTTLLFRKKDFKGLIQVTDKLIELTDNPFYLAQKGMYFELEGNTKEANEYFSEAIDKYKEKLKSDTLSFNLMIDYVSVLKVSGDSLKADKILTEMKEMDFEDYQIKMIDLYKKQEVFNEQFIKYWTGEIEYDQIEEK